MERLEPAAGFHIPSVNSPPPSFRFAGGMAILAMLFHGRDARATIATRGASLASQWIGAGAEEIMNDE